MSAVHPYPQGYECSLGTPVPAAPSPFLTVLVARSKDRTVFYRSNPGRGFEPTEGINVYCRCVLRR